MKALIYFLVLGVLSQRTCLAATRNYFVQAELVLWDYLPSNRNLMPIDQPLCEDNEHCSTFGAQVNSSDTSARIGHQYHKCCYFEYTDASFTRSVEKPPEQEHFGILGPLITARVGDTIEIVFRNQCPFETSMHPHGVLYKKDSEGAQYGSPDYPANGVDTGEEVNYLWEVPERAGPGPGDFSSVAWMYHSHVDPTREENAGLVGPILIAGSDFRSDDVDRIFFTLMNVYNENMSPLLEQNIDIVFDGRQSTREELINDEEFEESNLMHAINGLLFANLQGLVMEKGDKVQWHSMAMGTEVDLHTPHWHGVTLLTSSGRRLDTIGMLPAEIYSLELTADNPGTWMYHCHVNDHIDAGMSTVFSIVEENSGLYIDRANFEGLEEDICTPGIGASAGEVPGTETDENCHDQDCCRSNCAANSQCTFYSWIALVGGGKGCRLYPEGDIKRISSEPWTYCRFSAADVSSWTAEEILADPRTWFDFWDADRSGNLARDEVILSLHSLSNLSEGDVVGITYALWDSFDSDGDGMVEFNEFGAPDGLLETIQANFGSTSPGPGNNRKSSSLYYQSSWFYGSRDAVDTNKKSDSSGKVHIGGGVALGVAIIFMIVMVKKRKNYVRMGTISEMEASSI